MNRLILGVGLLLVATGCRQESAPTAKMPNAVEARETMTTNAVQPSSPAPAPEGTRADAPETKGLGDRFNIELAVYDFLFSRGVGATNNMRFAAVAMGGTNTVEHQALVQHFAWAKIPIRRRDEVESDRRTNLKDKATGGRACVLSVTIQTQSADRASAMGIWATSGIGAEFWKFELQKIDGRWKITKSQLVGMA